MTERKKYVTKDERKEFMHWLISPESSKDSKQTQTNI